MSLFKKTEDDMKAALKSGAAEKLSVLRMAVAAVRQLMIDKNVAEPSDADVLQIISRQIKQHRESIEQFKKGNRPDLAEKEASELKILETYMPEPFTQDELQALVQAAVVETNATTKADMGNVMKAVMEKAEGRADGTAVKELVMKVLT